MHFLWPAWGWVSCFWGGVAIKAEEVSFPELQGEHTGLSFQEGNCLHCLSQATGENCFLVIERNSCPSAHKCCFCPFCAPSMPAAACFTFSHFQMTVKVEVRNGTQGQGIVGENEVKCPAAHDCTVLFLGLRFPEQPGAGKL